jgi:hypothetical protein
MEGVGARLGRSSARYGPATTFTGPVRKWRKEWVPIAAATGSATSTAASSTGAGSRGNNLVLFKWTPLNGANGRGGGDEELTAPAEMATRRRRYVPVRILMYFLGFDVASFWCYDGLDLVSGGILLLLLFVHASRN